MVLNKDPLKIRVKTLYRCDFSIVEEYQYEDDGLINFVMNNNEWISIDSIEEIKKIRDFFCRLC